MFSDENVSLYGKTVIDSENGKRIDPLDEFKNGNALFCFVETWECASLAESDTDFGILPIPKADENAEYITYSDTRMSSDIMIPKGIGDADLTRTVLEAMAALGRKYFRPAAFEAWLAEEEADLESVRSLKIAFETKKYDAVHQLTGSYDCNCDADIGSLLNRVMTNPEAEIESAYFMGAKLANKHIEKLLASTENR